MSGRIRPPYPEGLEELLREALAARADTVGAGDLRPALPPSAHGVPRWRGLRRTVPAALGLAAAAAAVVILVHGANGGRPDPSVVPAGPSVSSTGSPSSTASPTPRTVGPAPAPTSSSAAERSGPALPGAAPR
ncbi:hypothetical protein PV703_04075 [Streptomyces sp. ME01-24h]|nr:hypothetical protein [Streptomyces sp. ME19-03-3]MDX3352513.1 hypothetical protein [Streptomyces sp. ME01-24h]